MTIPIAWTRKEHNVEQLVFASDSRISAGEKFDACPKMLALPRIDCAISYAGTSGDALSMMLQLSLAEDLTRSERCSNSGSRLWITASERGLR